MKKFLITLAAALAVACAPAPQTLKVMSYNVRTSVKDDGPNSWEFRKAATPAMIGEEKPDVFGVQEATEEQIAYIGETCPDYAGFGEGRNLDRTGEHASIFYNKNKLKLLDGGTWWLSETPDEPSVGWDAKYPRTATWALLEDLRSGKQFYFVNTHLDHKGVEARQNGLKMIMDKTGEMNPDIPLIITGDFNVQPGDECLQDIDASMQSARAVAAKTTDKASCNHYEEVSTEIIDYIYFKGFEKALDFDVLDKSYAGVPYISDHYPVVATLVYE